jgi:hypothetical protein
VSILQTRDFSHPEPPAEPVTISATCVVPLVAGVCGKQVPAGLALPICLSHAATAWEYCQGRISRSRLDNREVEDTARAVGFVEEFAAARAVVAEEHAALEADPDIDDPDSVVYYLRFADRVKIGFSRNLGRRLLAIPHDELLAVEPGGPVVEDRRHQQFAKHRLVGEWFQLCDELRSHIDAVKAAEAERSKGEQRLAAALETIEPSPPWADDADRLASMVSASGPGG